MGTELLVLDDWGLAPDSATESRDILESLDDRSQRRSTVVARQLPLELWHGTIGDATVAALRQPAKDTFMSVVGFNRNERSIWTGISGRFASESVVDLAGIPTATRQVYPAVVLLIPVLVGESRVIRSVNKAE